MEQTKLEKLEKLWDELLKVRGGPTNNDLHCIIQQVAPLREKAGQKLLEQNPTDNDLRYIIEWVEPLRAKAVKLLMRTPQKIISEMKSLI